MNRKKRGFTLVELLITIAIIATLVGILIPTLSVVRQTAKEVKQKAQLTTIELAIVAFKNDYGDYPPSYVPPPGGPDDYCGAQKLAEALVGWDLLGFHPKSAWMAQGYDGLTPGGSLTYDPDKKRDNNKDGILDTLNERKGPYLELATASAFKTWEVISRDVPSWDTYVLCDVFGRKSVTIGTKSVKAGTPILYYKADTSGKSITRIYRRVDNDSLIYIKELEDRAKHPGLRPPLNPLFDASSFISYIKDPKITAPAPPWPYRPDSYILISAGADGFYGTEDDIRNFGY